jgi:hypothetical protein
MAHGVDSCLAHPPSLLAWMRTLEWFKEPGCQARALRLVGTRPAAHQPLEELAVRACSDELEGAPLVSLPSIRLQAGKHLVHAHLLRALFGALFMRVYT